MKILDKKQVKNIIKELQDYYEIKELKLDYIFLQNNDYKVYIISKELKNMDLRRLKVNGLGLYFLNISKGLRLSIEGSQIIGKLAKKNTYKITDKELKEWLKGHELDTKEDYTGYKIIKNKEDFYGVGYFKNNKIKNFIPKYRRIKNI